MTRRRPLKSAVCDLSPTGSIMEGAGLLAQGTGCCVGSVMRWVRVTEPNAADFYQSVIDALRVAPEAEIAALGKKLAKVAEGNVLESVILTATAARKWTETAAGERKAKKTEAKAPKAAEKTSKPAKAEKPEKPTKAAPKVKAKPEPKAKPAAAAPKAAKAPKATKSKAPAVLDGFVPAGEPDATAPAA